MTVFSNDSVEWGTERWLPAVIFHHWSVYPSILNRRSHIWPVATATAVMSHSRAVLCLNARCFCESPLPRSASAAQSEFSALQWGSEAAATVGRVKERKTRSKKTESLWDFFFFHCRVVAAAAVVCNVCKCFMFGTASFTIMFYSRPSGLRFDGIFAAAETCENTALLELMPAVPAENAVQCWVNDIRLVQHSLTCRGRAVIVPQDSPTHLEHDPKSWDFWGDREKLLLMMKMMMVIFHSYISSIPETEGLREMLILAADRAADHLSLTELVLEELDRLVRRVFPSDQQSLTFLTNLILRPHVRPSPDHKNICLL